MFQEFPAGRVSILLRKPIYGVGLNDADYVVYKKIDGVIYRCPFYVKWASMLFRCYSLKYQVVHHTYKNCFVCREWLTFSRFKEWMKCQDWENKELDKDILLQGNKEYSPEKCIFIDRKINLLLNENKAKRGDFKIGVGLERSGMFAARCKNNGKYHHIGLYKTEIDAHEAYKNYKYSLISKIAESQSDQIKSALLNYRISG